LGASASSWSRPPPIRSIAWWAKERADDYIAKPFGPRELLARVRKRLRAPPARPQHTGPRVRGRRVLDLEKRVLIDPPRATRGLAARKLIPRRCLRKSQPAAQSRLAAGVTAHREMKPSIARSTCASRGCAASKIDPAHPDAIARCAASAVAFVAEETDIFL
jgi:hypothetical protein